MSEADLDRSITVYVAGEPMAQGRPRLAVIAGRASAYDPAKSRSAKNDVRLAMMQSILKHPIHREGLIAFPEGGLHVVINCVFSMPKGDHRKVPSMIMRWRAKRPDVDNLMKTVLDAGTGILWKDDSQVVHVTVTKMTALQNGQPYTEILVRSIEA